MSENITSLSFKVGRKGIEAYNGTDGNWYVPDHRQGRGIVADRMYRVEVVGESKRTRFVRPLEDLTAVCERHMAALKQAIDAGQLAGTMDDEVTFTIQPWLTFPNSVTADESGRITVSRWTAYLRCSDKSRTIWASKEDHGHRVYRNTEYESVGITHTAPLPSPTVEQLKEVGVTLLHCWMTGSKYPERYRQEADRAGRLRELLGGWSTVEKWLAKYLPVSPATFDEVVKTTVANMEAAPESKRIAKVKTTLGERDVRWSIDGVGVVSAYNHDEYKSMKLLDDVTGLAVAWTEEILEDISDDGYTAGQVFETDYHPHRRPLTK
ncbi:MAG TPA: hypothetical protein DDW41_03815 [Candidatus Andersenbacteria bacterium]|nr:MAG: hypothetical protein UW94_C0014G0016 [Parcubacteria group bacterium GW2011_GWA2_45_14]OGY33981.1 MAG: hypothetical protein A3B76_02230 [Candidatus Andersenbacteria bacterium RIFCSPHIGHO2_02_FULL_46_16]OGY37572.1 MAG: hypothetical protein A3I08_04185 [Candidatus Andersenbacteria bacterium RIFCSPLOWO2_02_FULL_46_11]HBE90308.1 hypothetical protein [Candidatus Andersenbacteria bacterium]